MQIAGVRSGVESGHNFEKGEKIPFLIGEKKTPQEHFSDLAFNWRADHVGQADKQAKLLHGEQSNM